ncbi:hypothetical protein N7462_004789 [Penicillium macrosclerotiorum]|uniref:uncharacterized protein n=1 Tax=Penicillium macrosclerotiorum TaxID=303699 RepID=UPI00254871FF|nr:uncharacterized protein N7462_004789 [Penicillium macrosclerotiorum]KAJ5690397.1 hypothetical protein N7462_004789 [Penicillium macrosclerotiorum]
MSTLTHGGRIVPILTGHQQHQHLDSTTPSSDVLQNHIFPPAIHPSPLLVQQEDTPAIRQNKASDHQCLEMPCLKQRSLFALPTEGDGNCLYYSLSDQLYGNFEHGHEIRQTLAEHIADNRDYFMQFVVAKGGERRRPKRSAVSAYATRSADVAAPSEEDKERRFEEMVASTRKNGEWGSSEHLQAFCQAYQVDINVYTMEGVQAFRDVNASHDEHREVVHVAFHDFKHYSSVRPLDGPHHALFALPKTQIGPRPCLTKPEETDSKASILSDSKDLGDNPIHPSPSKDYDDTIKNNNLTSDIPIPPNNPPQDPTPDPMLAVDVFPPWDIQSIQDGLGGRYDRDTIVDMLQKCRGDIDRAFAALLGETNEDSTGKKLAPGPCFKSSLQVSRESSPFSTGSKRSAEDSDDSEDPRPAVRRGRPKKRAVSNLTLGVGISFRDDQNEVVSLNLRVSTIQFPRAGTCADRFHKQMKADAEKAEKAEADPVFVSNEGTPVQSDSDTKSRPRRSGRLSKPRPA